MTTPASNPAFSEVRTAILTIAKRMEDAPDLPQDGLADLKSAVDDVRIRLWGILMASDASDYKGFVVRFRMRRAAECLEGLVEDVSRGRFSRDSIESKMLYSSARQIANYLDPGNPAAEAIHPIR